MACGRRWRVGGVGARHRAGSGTLARLFTRAIAAAQARLPSSAPPPRRHHRRPCSSLVRAAGAVCVWVVSGPGSRSGAAPAPWPHTGPIADLPGVGTSAVPTPPRRKIHIGGWRGGEQQPRNVQRAEASEARVFRCDVASDGIFNPMLGRDSRHHKTRVPRANSLSPTPCAAALRERRRGCRAERTGEVVRSPCVLFLLSRSVALLSRWSKRHS